MKGRIEIRVSNNRAKFHFTLERNITIVRGDSGTGKTTLYEMIAEHMRLGEASGVQVSSPCPCAALTDMDWQNQLRQTQGSVVFIDEGAEYLATTDFASTAQDTDNYFVIFNRENLHALPYSIEEIYEIKTSNKYHTFQKVYKRREGYVYAAANGRKKATANVVLTEDTHAGFEFYQHLYDGTAIRCETAGSNSGIFAWLQTHHQDGVFVIADGAAFGAEMDRVMKLQKQYPEDIRVCLPESFEWLILQSGLLPIPGLKEMLADPGQHIESADFFSWEQFFASYLIQHTEGNYYVYSKSRLHSFYTIRENAGKIVAVISENMPEWKE
ncbi:MAG: hypothetical protein IKN04_23735 [Clostridia bacterium]|nr:hypothetical protein [Clostridia bacterium]